MSNVRMMPPLCLHQTCQRIELDYHGIHGARGGLLAVDMYSPPYGINAR